MARIALIGDRDDSVLAHRAIPAALDLSARALGVEVRAVWIGTETVDPSLAALEGFSGVWCVPASPYRDTDGALRAIRWAREGGIPFLGTCGGFQHAVLECARSVWGIAGAAHAELDPGAADPVIAPLVCSLVEKRGRVRLAPDSRLAAAYGRDTAEEGYHCSYGLSPTCADHLEAGPLVATAWDEEGDVRGVELEGHPFFVATLFQPEREALRGAAPPVVAAFVAAASRARDEGPAVRERGLDVLG